MFQLDPQGFEIIFKVEEGSEDTYLIKSCPLVDATAKASLDVVKLLLTKGADVATKDCWNKDTLGQKRFNHVLFAAVNSCLNLRSCKKRLAILKELLKVGLEVNTLEHGTKYEMKCALVHEYN